MIVSLSISICRNWTSHLACKFSIPDVDRVAQWNLDQCSIVSSCSFSTKNGGTLSVRYFADNPQFGTDEQKLDDILLHHLFGISYQVLITSKNLENKLQELENRIQQRSDYGQDICCLYNRQNELPSIQLCGTKSNIQQIYQDFKKISDEYAPMPCRVQLQPNEVRIQISSWSQSIQLSIFSPKWYLNESYLFIIFSTALFPTV
jgi:hypothetical protein